ncbi:MAG TPA: AMP-binding protein [Baekduia sp.]|jgi:fatty-acyl-CoA synthase
MAATLAGMLDAVADRSPDAPALIERADGATRTLTYAELRTAAGDLAAQLAARGIGRGSVVGVWLPNWIEAITIEFALASLGAANLGINTRYGVHELAHLVRTGRPAALVLPRAFHGLDFTGRFAQALADVGPDIDHPWTAFVGDGAWAFPDAPAGTAAPAAPTGAPTDMVNYFTTSGSTGAPKLAGHDQAAVTTHARNAAAAFAMAPGDTVLCALPLSGVFGFNPAMAMLSVGGTCLLEPMFDAGTVLADMADAHVTHAIGGDDLLGRLKDAWDADPRPLPAFRRGGIADFVGRSAEVVAWAQRDLGADIGGVYGSSELFALTAVRPAGTTTDPSDRARGGGRLVSDGIEVRVADPADGRTLPAGEVGELQFRGYNVLTGYLRNPEAAERAFTPDGWFRSGDLGYLEPGGGDTFAYTCRAGDALRLRGFLVEPAEIEQFLMTHPAVDTAKVVGVQAGEGDVAVAYVTLREAAEVADGELLAFCRARLARFKLPEAITVIDAFPVTTGTNGTKIRTAELRAWAAAQLGSAET